MKTVSIGLNIVCPFCGKEHEPIKREWDCVSSSEVMSMYCSDCGILFNVSKRVEMDKSVSYMTSSTELEE